MLKNVLCSGTTKAPAPLIPFDLFSKLTNRSAQPAFTQSEIFNVFISWPAQSVQCLRFRSPHKPAPQKNKSYSGKNVFFQKLPILLDFCQSAKHHVTVFNCVSKHTHSVIFKLRIPAKVTIIIISAFLSS